jgi:hypothetical protein
MLTVGTKKMRNLALAFIFPKFSDFLRCLVQPVLVSGQANHFDRCKPLRRIGSRIAVVVSLLTASKICLSLSVKPGSFAVAWTSNRAGGFLAAHLTSVAWLNRQS